MSKYDYAKLRPIQVHRMVHEGVPIFVFQDRLDLGPQTVVPQALGPVLAACDGDNTVTAMCQQFRLHTGQTIQEDDVEHWLARLDDAYLLDNERATQAKEDILTRYRKQPYRPPTIAGRGYPADPQALRQAFQQYIDQASQTDELETGYGLVSPHIDYFRGGHVYAQVWKRVAKLAREAECVIILGTDHNSPIPGEMTLTRQDYATPFGVLPTDQTVVDAIVAALPDEDLFASELHHRSEWSIELPAVWLHFIRDGEACPIVPILCGSFYDFVMNGRKPAQDARLNTLIDTVKQATAGRKILVVASGDLAHIGPEFGGDPIDQAGHEQLKRDDDQLLNPVYAGDADAFFEVIRAEQDSRNVCGTSPIYLAMKIMGDVQGEIVAYDRCSADDQDTSYVSVCGVTFG
ncbi:MAG: AmmeMemoRadiSam system protein B [Chloroflexota bacterium]